MWTWRQSKVASEENVKEMCEYTSDSDRMPPLVHSWFPRHACTLLIWDFATNNLHRIICQLCSQMAKTRSDVLMLLLWSKISQSHSSPVRLCKDTPTQFETLRLPSSYLEVKKPFGWEVKRLQESETSPVAYDTALIFTMTCMTENLHQHIAPFLNQRVKVRRSWSLGRDASSSLICIIKTEIIEVQLLVKDLFSLSVGGKIVLNYNREWKAPLKVEQFALAEAKLNSFNDCDNLSACRGRGIMPKNTLLWALIFSAILTGCKCRILY